MFKRLSLFWHTLRFLYNRIIIKDCLCDKTRAQIQEKIDYHEIKINEIKALK